MNWIRAAWEIFTRNKSGESMERANHQWEALYSRVMSRLDAVESRLEKCLEDCADCHAARDKQQGEIDRLTRRVGELEK